MCFFCLPFLLICSRCVREVLGASIQLTCDVSPAAHGTLANCAPKGVSNERFQNPQNDVFLQDLLFQTRFGGKSLVRSLFFLIYWGYRWKDVLRKKPGGSCILYTCYPVRVFRYPRPAPPAPPRNSPPGHGHLGHIPFSVESWLLGKESQSVQLQFPVASILFLIHEMIS